MLLGHYSTEIHVCQEKKLDRHFLLVSAVLPEGTGVTLDFIP